MKNTGLLRTALRARRFLFLEAVAAQHVGHRLVAFVAGVLVDQLVLVPQRNHRRPRRGPRRRIVDGELVVEDVLADAGEPLDYVQVFVGAHEMALWPGVW